MNNIQQIGQKIGEARSARNRGDNRTARRLAENAMEMINKTELSFDNMDWRLLAQGDAQELAGDLDAAEKSYRQAISAAPDGSGGYSRLAELLESQNRTSELLDHLDKGLERFPDHAGWYKMRAALHQKSDRTREAIDDYIAHLKINDTDTEAMNNVGELLQSMGKFEEASLYHAAALQIEPGKALHALQMAHAMEGVGNIEAAEEIYQAILKAQPEHAEVWLGYGLLHHKQNKFSDAEKIYRQALDRNVRSPFIYQNLGDTLLEQDKKEEALSYYEKALALDPKSEIIQFKIAGLKGKTPNSAPREYVTQLFDHFSSNFEESLLGALRYQAPSILAQMIEAHQNVLNNNLVNAHAIDLGCGTGLVGVALKNKIAEIDGVDLSQKMLDRATEKRVYRHLEKADLADFLEQEAEGRYNIAVAGDVFIYVGDLNPIFEILSKKLAAPSLFAFSLEKLDENSGAPFVLGNSARYQHKESYVRDLAQKYSFAIEEIKEDTLRQNADKAIAGLFVVLSKR